MQPAKAQLREAFKRQRQSLSGVEVAAASQKIAKKLMAELDWSKVKSVHIYRAQPAWREVDSQKIIELIHQDYPHIKVSQPSLDRYQPLPKTTYDLIIVPVLAFDRHNLRLGLGGGWYDRFLASQPRAKKIGLAYHFAKVKAGLPYEPHDIKLDQIITEL